MPQQKAEALFDFSPTAAVELGLKKGDVIIIRRMDVGEGWWEGELNGLRGLLPCSYVKLLPLENSPSHDNPKIPLTPSVSPLMSPLAPGMSTVTPGMSKKAFMETLLAPTTLANDQFYSKEKSLEFFIQGHSDIGVTVGPSWDCYPPKYSITVRHQQPESRHSGLKHWSSYLVDTKQLSSSVTRKFKHFLGLYDKMAEIFPCVSLPPLPVKQLSGARDPDGVEARRRGLERFLERVAKHPVLCSTKIFHAFLTTKDDKDWKIGRHSSVMKLPKSSKKLFGAPVYNMVQYPAYNVPLNQLASIDRFSKFSRLLEVNVQTLQSSYTQLSATNTDMLNTLSMLSRDIQRFSKGMQPIAGAQRRRLATSSMSQGIANSNQGAVSAIHVSLAAPKSTAADAEEGELEEEEGEGIGEWNWRENTRFSEMAHDMHDMAGGMRQISHQFMEHTQEDFLDTQVVDVLRDYSGIIHTLPVLVKLHEEAMEMYNASKEKDSKKDAEEIRQQCDTLNNILLAEFDFFSEQMIDDFEEIMESFLCRQANYHRQLAKEWDNLHIRYNKRLSSRMRQNKTSNGSEDLRLEGSGSFTSLSPTSSEDLTLNLQDVLSVMDEAKKSSTTDNNLSSKQAEFHSDSKIMMIPTYINVERKLPSEPGEGGLTESDVFDPEILKPKKKGSFSEDGRAPISAPRSSSNSSGSNDVPVSSRPSGDATPSHSGDALGPPPPPSPKMKKIKKTDSPLVTATPSSKQVSAHSESNSLENKIGVSNSTSNSRGNDDTSPSLSDTIATTSIIINERKCESDPRDDTTTSHDFIAMTKIGGDMCSLPNSKGERCATTPSTNNVTMMNVSGRYEMACPQFLVPVHQESTTQGHEYANLKFAMGNKALTGQRSDGTGSSKSSPKKPMPIQRKIKSTSDEMIQEDIVNSGVSTTTSTPKTGHHSTVTGVPVSTTTSTPKTGHHSTVTGVPASGVSTTTSTSRTTSASVSKKPVPPVKPPKLALMDSIGVSSTKPTTKTADSRPTHPSSSTPPVDKPRPLSSILANLSTESATSDEEEKGLGSQSIVTKPRSYTCVTQRSEFIKKQPLFPPASSIPMTLNGGGKSSSSSSTNQNPAIDKQDELAKSSQAATTSSQPFLAKPRVTVQGASRTKVGPSTLTSELAPSASVATASNSTVFEKGTKLILPTATGSKGSRPAKPPPPVNAGSRGSTQSMTDEKSPKGREELMRKLSLRRLRIEEQIASTAPTTMDSIPNPDSISPIVVEEAWSAEQRHSHLSSAGSHSEVVVAYHAKNPKEGELKSGTGLGVSVNSLEQFSSQGDSSGSYVVDGPSVILRKRGEEEGEAGEAEGRGSDGGIESKDNTLAKYGILEDAEGGSYII